MARAPEQSHFGVRQAALLPGFFGQCTNSRGMASTKRGLQIGKVSKGPGGGFHLSIVQHAAWAWLASQHFLSQRTWHLQHAGGAPTKHFSDRGVVGDACPFAHRSSCGLGAKKVMEDYGVV